MDLTRRVCRRVFNVFYGGWVRRRMARPSEVELRGRRLLTDPEVFHPIYFLSTRILVDWFARRELRGKRFLDMGTGSGSIAIFAAAAGARVTACDINPRAVANAGENARRNGVAVEVLQSDTYAALPGRRFDVIAFNVPFYPGRPRSHLEAAFYAGEDFATVRAFAAGCPEHLEPGGMVVIIFAEESGRDGILAMFAAHGLVPIEEEITAKLFERFYVVRLELATSARAAG
jgi:release factor glutamine methyltransferase